MSERITKSVNLTEDEIWALQQYHAQQIVNSGPAYDTPLERLNYLNKRLKAFSEAPSVGSSEATAAEPAPAPAWLGS